MQMPFVTKDLLMSKFVFNLLHINVLFQCECFFYNIDDVAYIVTSTMLHMTLDNEDVHVHVHVTL